MITLINENGEIVERAKEPELTRKQIAHVAFRIAESLYRKHNPYLSSEAEIEKHCGHLYDSEE